MSDQEKGTQKLSQIDHCKSSNVVDKTKNSNDDSALQSMMAAVKLDSETVNDS